MIRKYLKEKRQEKDAAAQGSGDRESEVDDNSLTETDEEKNESASVRLLRHLRNKFIERSLVGSITITRVSGITTSSISCDVPETADECAVEGDIEENPADVKALRSMDALIKNVLKRSKGNIMPSR